MHYQGSYMERDMRQAVHWLSKAAEQGAQQAQFLAGLIYLNDLRDYRAAFHWNREAARQNSAEAQFNLGCQFANGLGVNKDRGQALEWYRRCHNLARTDASRAELAEKSASAIEQLQGDSGRANPAPG